jgi:hypothetical protein
MGPPPKRPLIETPTRRRKTGVVAVGRSKCVSCSAPLIWAQTERGKRMPVDAQLNSTGNLVLCFEVDQFDRPVSGQLVVTAPEGYAGPRWLSHFATCPKAALWQRRNALRGEL